MGSKVIRPDDVQYPEDLLIIHPGKRLSFVYGCLDARSARRQASLRGRHVYTDGSSTSTLAGAAYVCMLDADEIKAVGRFRLVPPTSAYDAEVLAMLRATEYLVQNDKPGQVSIYTDCLSLLNAISSYYNDTTELLEIKDNITALCYVTELQLFHVRGHTGVRGNELADLVARGAALHNLETPMKVSRRKIKTALAHAVQIRLDAQWQLNKDTELYRWVPSAMNIPAWFPASKTLTHLISGHGLFAHYFHRIELLTEAVCFCGNEANGIDHYLRECPAMTACTTQIQRVSRRPLAPPHLRQLIKNCATIELLTALVEHIERTTPQV